MIKEVAIHQFWSSFGLPAYDENTVIDPTTGKKPKEPYITYDIVTGNLGQQCYMNAALWYRSTSWTAITEKKNEIERRFGYGEIIEEIDGGYVRLWKGSPFAQRGNDPEDAGVRVYNISYVAEFCTAD